MREKLKLVFNKEKNPILLACIGMFVLLLLVVGAAYAYFLEEAELGTSADINASTGITDTLSFNAGKPIQIHADMNNFAPGEKNLVGETTATATLMANNITNQASGRYNVFFIIDNNDFEYVTENGQAEIIMKITDPNGNEIEDITGLKRVDGGFDITTRTGGFLVAADYEIEASGQNTTNTQTWTIEVTLINLDLSQNKNKGKTLNGIFYITTEQESTYEIAKIHAVNTSTTFNSVTANVSSTAGSAEIEKYYYAIEEISSEVAYLGAGVSVSRLSNAIAINDTDYIESDDPTYTFNNLKSNTNYKVYSYVKDKNRIKSNIYTTEVFTGDYTAPVIDSVTTSNTTNSITVNVNSRLGSAEASKYYYSINGGAFVESDGASHTFEGLTENTTYTIGVKIKDTTGTESEVYTLNAKTVTLATITNIETSVTPSSITVNVTAEKGDANIAKYYYSNDDGATWSEGTTSSSYTFNNLISNTLYNIKVKVTDTEGRESSEATALAKTGYISPTINSVEHSSTLNSITLNVTALAGSNAIAKYYYSKDNGANYVESENSSYTFTDLLDTTDYKIKVKVSDTEEHFSAEYYKSIATTAYVNPSITNVSNSKTYNSISLTTTATGGTSSVANYYYKIGTGSWSAAQSTNTYTITGLTENTAYTIYVKVSDANGRESNEYSLNVTTNQYILPSVSATTSSTSSSVTVNATGTKGTGTIASYKFSRDGGSNWTTVTSSSTTASYTFSSLTSNTTYQIRVKIVDNNGRESSVYSTTATTSYIYPTVSINSTSKTSNTITVNYSGTAGSKAISYYQVSCNGGSSYTTNYTTSYTCTGLAGNTTYQIRVIAVDTGGVQSAPASTNVTTDVGTFAAYIKSLYTSDGNNNLYYHDATGTYTNSNLEAGDYSYRYAGRDPNNYVCFGSSLSTCPEANLYRIIGVFEDQVKLIKATVATPAEIGSTAYGRYDDNRFYWSGSSSSQSNSWVSSTLNTDSLNGTYLTNLGTSWANKIASSSWYVAGLSQANAYNYHALTAYTYEIFVNKSNPVVIAKVGMPYLSEYYYAASPEYWSNNGGDYTSAKYYNWMFNYTTFWTISRNTDVTGTAFSVNNTGSAGTYSYVNGDFAILPTFYLNSSVAFLSGTGTQSDPYRIN